MLRWCLKLRYMSFLEEKTNQRKCENSHRCSVWFSFKCLFPHHFAQRSNWWIEELISDYSFLWLVLLVIGILPTEQEKQPCAVTLPPWRLTHVFVPLCTQWVFVFVSMCLWSCGSSSVHDIAVIKEVNSSVCVCVCATESLKSFSGSRRAVGLLLNKPNAQHNSMNKTQFRHKRSRPARCSDSNVSLPAFCKRHCSNPPTILPTHLFISLIYSSFNPENNVYCNSWNCVEL